MEICRLPQLQVRVAVAPALTPAPFPAPALLLASSLALVLVLAPDPLSCSESGVGRSHALRQRIFLVATVGRYGGQEEKDEEKGNKEDTESNYSFSASSPPPYESRPFLKPPLVSSSTKSPWNAEAYGEGALKVSSGSTVVIFPEGEPDSTPRTREKGSQR